MPDAICFLSPVDEDGKFHYDPFLNRPLWQNYLIFYRDSAGDIRLAKRSAVGTPAETVPMKIGTTGADRRVDLTPYYVDGKLLAQSSTSLSFRVLPLIETERHDRNELLEVTVVLEKDAKGQTTPRRLETVGVVHFRN
jgi:hypothetical protein